MFVGHLAAAFGARVADRRVPLSVALLALGLAAYVRVTAARDSAGRWALVALVALTTAMWIIQPSTPPPPSPTAIALGSLALWLLPLWAGWVDRHRRPL